MKDHCDIESWRSETLIWPSHRLLNLKTAQRPSSTSFELFWQERKYSSNLILVSPFFPWRTSFGMQREHEDVAEALGLFKGHDESGPADVLLQFPSVLPSAVKENKNEPLDRRRRLTTHEKEPKRQTAYSLNQLPPGKVIPKHQLCAQNFVNSALCTISAIFSIVWKLYLGCWTSATFLWVLWW